MLLRDSEVAKAVRTELLNIEERTKPQQALPDPLKSKRVEIMELNAKTRQAKLLLEMTQRFKDRLSDVAIEGMLAVSAAVLTGKELLPLPKTEKLYTATDIAQMIPGMIAHKLGRISNQFGLKTDEYGIWALDKSPYSSKQIESFRYNERGKNRLLEIMQPDDSDLQ